MAKKSGRSSDNCFNWLCCCQVFLGIFIVIGVLLAAVGVFAILKYDSFFMKMLKQKLPLTPTSKSYASFANPPANIYQSFYFFNITNPEQVLNGSKPIVKEIGPYVYTNKRVKENIEFSDDGNEVSYGERRFYVFDEKLSDGRSDNDTFYNLDLVSYKIAKSAKEEGKLMFVARTLSRSKRKSPMKSHVVREFLFGAEDILLVKILPLKFPDPETRPPSSFGILINKETGNSKNGSIDSNYTLKTGTADVNKYQHIVTYNGMSRMPDYWPTNITDPTTGELSDPNVIRGTPGSGFPPDVKKDSHLHAFAADICTSIELSYQKATSVGGVDTYRFGIDIDKWVPYVGDINRAQCSPEDRDDPIKCAQNGLLNVTNCKGGAALMMSLPHLLHADPYYRNTVDGLQPDAEKHSIFLDIDPVTGAVLKVAKRLQVNVRLIRFAYSDYRKIPEYTLMPIMWIEESGGINDVGLEGLKTRIHGKRDQLRTIAYAVLIAGIAILPIVIVIFLIFKQRYNANRHSSQYQMSQVYKNPNSDMYGGHKRQGDGYPDEKQPFRM